ncbi:sensor histidine kinase [Metabacillus halosaccharovorans]|uniref:sensor histidine kinase n=1 Tax=Metabacillus halosaccharovorans TaxID=930124 RepID=UPI0020416019|nr:sensor histidine kinase [Metabacillus halosaccharovorans]MCM3440446.1 histidine kinase [Metabacillus halosaccharovorans]
MKGITQILTSLSLRQRLIISALLCVILPSLITYMVSAYFTKDTLEQRAVKQSQDTLRLLDLNISNYIEDLMYVSNYIQFDGKMNSILKESKYYNKENLPFNKASAIQHIKISSNLEGITNLLTPSYITILMQNDFSYTNYPAYEYDPKNFYKEDWFQKIKNLDSYETFWLGTHPTFIQSQEKTNPYLISIASTLKTSGTTYAYTIISINEKDISNLFKQFGSNNEQKIMLINANGTILSDQNEKEIQKKFQYIKYINKKQESYSIVDYKDKEYLLVSRPLAYSDWKLVSLVPYKKTVGQINTITHTTLLLQAILFSFFLFILIYLMNKFTKPIDKLSRVMKKVENGNIRIRTGIKGEGDIELLGSSFDQMLDKIELMIKQIKIEENSKRKAELEMLQAQVNPHFLFNTLNSIRLKITMNGDNENAKLIQSLSSLLRMTITRNNEFVTLHEEIEVVHHYVKLMIFRQQYNIETNCDLASNVLLEEVPRFFLQPIIENSIIHGFNQKGGVIDISACLVEDSMVISVKDNGKGMTDERLHHLQSHYLTTENHEEMGKKASLTGIGISNVYQRLKLIYGDEFQMNIISQEAKGTEITFYIPRKRGVKNVSGHISR